MSFSLTVTSFLRPANAVLSITQGKTNISSLAPSLTVAHFVVGVQGWQQNEVGGVQSSGYPLLFLLSLKRSHTSSQEGTILLFCFPFCLPFGGGDSGWVEESPNTRKVAGSNPPPPALAWRPTHVLRLGNYLANIFLFIHSQQPSPFIYTSICLWHVSAKKMFHRFRM